MRRSSTLQKVKQVCAPQTAVLGQSYSTEGCRRFPTVLFVFLDRFGLKPAQLSPRYATGQLWVSCETAQWTVKFTHELKKNFVLILYIWSQISKKVGTENLLAVLLSCYELHVNRYSESHTLLTDIGEIVSAFSTFIFPIFGKTRYCRLADNYVGFFQLL